MRHTAQTLKGFCLLYHHLHDTVSKDIEQDEDKLIEERLPPALTPNLLQSVL